MVAVGATTVTVTVTDHQQICVEGARIFGPPLFLS
jgi:hypothetical protein